MGSREQQSSSGNRRSSRESSLITMGTIASTLEEARASLKQPSRPFTPAQDERHMFVSSGESYASRPSTAYGVDSSNFLEGLMRPPTASTRLAPISTPQPKEMQPHPPSEENNNGKRRIRRRSSSNNVTKPTEEAGEKTRRSKKTEMDNLRATLEAAIPATPPTTPREPESNASSENISSATDSPSSSSSSSIKPSTTAWIKIKGSLPSLEPASGSDVILNGISQIEATLRSLSDSTGTPKPLSTPKAKYVLERLFRLTDVTDSIVLMRVCKLIYMVADAPVHILNVSKLLYNLSKSAENDPLFRKEKILELLVNIASDEKDPRSKILVYGLGALKNVTTAEQNQRALAEIPSLFPSLNNLLVTSLDLKGDDKMAQLLIQVTAIFRNLSLWKGTRQHMSDAIPNLCATLVAFSEHMEVVSNIFRVFSKITLTSDNQRTLSKCPGSIINLMKVLQSYSDNEALVLRTCFVLGNITDNIDENRKEIYYSKNTSNNLLSLLVKYNTTDIDNYRWLSKLNQSAKEATTNEEKAEREKKAAKLKAACKDTEQVLVKLVRLLANLAINEEIGHAIAASPEIETLHQLLERKEITQSEELVLNVVAAITNLSFSFFSDNVILKNQIAISKRLIPLLLFKNEEAIVESVRAYANFSRDPNVRKFMCEQRLDSMMAMLVEHSSVEVVQTVLGVLINLASDPLCQSFIQNDDLIEKLVDRLINTDLTDIVLCEMICKTLYNLISVSGIKLFNSSQTEHVRKFLTDNLEIISRQDNDIYEVLPAPKEKGEEEEDEVVTQTTEDKKVYGEFLDVASRLLVSLKV